jgi:hypothetical protein
MLQDSYYQSYCNYSFLDDCQHFIKRDNAQIDQIVCEEILVLKLNQNLSLLISLYNAGIIIVQISSPYTFVN